MHFVTTQTVEKLEEHQKRVKKHPTSLIKRTMETIGRDVAILSWLLWNNISKEIKLEGWNCRTQKTLSSCASSNEMSHKEINLFLFPKMTLNVQMKSSIYKRFYIWNLNAKRGSHCI